MKIEAPIPPTSNQPPSIPQLLLNSDRVVGRPTRRIGDLIFHINDTKTDYGLCTSLANQFFIEEQTRVYEVSRTIVFLPKISDANSFLPQNFTKKGFGGPQFCKLPFELYSESAIEAIIVRDKSEDQGIVLPFDDSLWHLIRVNALPRVFEKCLENLIRMQFPRFVYGFLYPNFKVSYLLDNSYLCKIEMYQILIYP
jgi:hypothetical protein